MADDSKQSVDLSQGVDVSGLADGGLVEGQVGEQAVILVRSGASLFAVGAACTHYQGPLAQGLVVEGTVRCPLHHACFDLRTGVALRAPALDPIPCWRVERVGDRAFVREPLAAPEVPKSAAGAPSSVVIVGGGAAGLACADMLRREGYDGPLTMLSADAAPPCDRPNLSKDYLAGSAPQEWIPLRPPEWYAERRIDLSLDTRVTAIDLSRREVELDGGRRLAYGALLLATGAEPVRIDVPGADPSRVFVLRSFADSQAIIAKAASARRVVVAGASFIALEVAASLRERGIEVDVVAPDSVPMQRVMGDEVGRFVQGLHEAHGVRFHLGATVARMQGTQVTLSDASVLEADFVVLGVGVRPATGLAEQAGLSIERGVTVDEYLQTSAPGVYAAGDIARWPDRASGQRIRVEHWVVAERQGQVAALNMLGRRQAHDAVPFFWSQHYDVTIRYVGHAEGWDAIAVEGSIAKGDATVRYQRGGLDLAVATIGRDLEGLKAERAMETRGA